MNDTDHAHRPVNVLHAPALLALSCAALLFAACSTLPAPRDYVPEADGAGADPRGSWANVRLKEGKKHVTVSGELLAVRADSLFLGVGRDLIPLSTRTIDRVQVAYFNPHEEGIYGLGALGAVSTISTGWFAGLGFPIWLIIGAASGASRVDEAVVTYPRQVENFAMLRPYARFPQGMPAAFHPAPEFIKLPPGVIKPAPSPVLPPSRYVTAESSGSGLVGSVGGFENGGTTWSAAFHQRVDRELFAMAGFTRFDRDALDMDQWWIGIRLGEPVFIGAKYNYSTQRDESASGIGGLFGFMVAAAPHVGVGATLGYDSTGLDSPRTDNLWWMTFQLQITLIQER
jgi:hypothetical protein